MTFLHRRDLYGGLIIVLLGLIAVQQGLASDLGTLSQVGPGLLPVVLGVLLVGLGFAIVLSGGATAEPVPASLEAAHQQWRAWLCIIGGPALFVLLGPVVGFIPASLACVFVAALGDRSSTMLGAAVLAACVTTVGGVLFLYFFNVPFPLIQWVLP